MKKLFSVLAVAGGLFLANICYGASSIFTWNATNTSDLTAWVGQTWSDFSAPILIFVGIGVGFVIIRKLIGVVKGAAR